MTTTALRETTPVGAGPRRRSRWWELVLPWLLPALAMAAVGSIGLTRPALGWDEHATWSAAERTPAQLLAFAGTMDGVIAPYYLFIHYWTAAFGDSEAMIRLPSLIAVVVGTALVGELGRRLAGPGTGLVAGLIVVTVPQLSRYAQDARAYGIAFLFAVLATLLLYVAAERPAWWRWAGYGAALTLLGATHIFGFLVLIGHVVTIVLRLRATRDARLPIRWAVMVASALVIDSPLIRLGLTQRGTQLDWIAPLDLHQVLLAPGLISGAPAAGLLIIGLALAARHEPRPALLGELGVLAAVPPVLLIAVSFVTSPLWVPRYVLFVIMPLAILAALALRGLRGRTVAALVLVAAMGFEAQQDVRGPASHGGMDFRQAASIVQAGLRPGDGIVYSRVGTWSLRAGLDYELRNSAVKPADLLLRTTAAEAGGLDAVECPGLTCFTTDRVWYVGTRKPSGDPMSTAGDELSGKFKAEYKRTGYWLPPLGTIALYERKVA